MVCVTVLPPTRYSNNIATGAYHFAEGVRLLLRKELRLFIIVPLLVNIVLFVVLTSALVHYYGGFVNSMLDALPSWLAPLAWLAWVLIGIIVLIIYGYSFNVITNIISAPFYGMLAAQTEKLLTGEEPPEESITQMVPRTLRRELSKLWYFLLRTIFIFLLIGLIAFIPVLNLLAPFIGIAWSAWTMSIQYTDYSADNNQLGFKSLRRCLWNKKFSCLGFGGVVMLVSVVPILNIFAMPAAVTGGTSFWLRELKRCHGDRCKL